MAAGSPGRSAKETAATTSSGAHRRAPVAQVEVVRADPPPPVRRAQDGPPQHPGQVGAVGARVHRHRAPGRARDAGAELEALEPGGAGALHRAGQAGAAAAPDVRAAHRDRLQAPGEPHHQAPEALVGHQQVGALAHDGHAGAGVPGPGQRRHHGPERRRRPRSSRPGRRPGCWSAGRAGRRRGAQGGSGRPRRVVTLPSWIPRRPINSCPSRVTSPAPRSAPGRPGAPRRPGRRRRGQGRRVARAGRARHGVGHQAPADPGTAASRAG